MEEFARLADHLRKGGQSSDRIAHFLIRLLFCLFAEDIELLPKGIFARMIELGRQRAGSFDNQLRQLFGAMAVGNFFGEHEIRHFNGGLFDNDTLLPLDSEGLEILHRVASLDWSNIEPSIFGTLFERSLDPSKRSQLGAHYTSKEDIQLIVEPVLMAPLRREWEQVKQQGTDLAQRRDTATTPQLRSRYQNEIERLINGFTQRLATIRVLDPACGSGNFLYVALRVLLDLWKEVAIFASSIGLPFMLPLPGFAPSPEQLYGIELNEYAYELAQATVWIGYIQWLHENGYGVPSEPILKPLDNIKHMDAILAYDADGKPVEPEWPVADVIVGNPPFLGGKKMRSNLGDTYVTDVFRLYDGIVPHEADLVCYWFVRARQLIEQAKLNRAGLLATNSIRGGANRRVLDQIKKTGNIFMAWSNRPWILDGATVHVSMVGFDNGSEKLKSLDGKIVDKINPDLTSTVDLTVARPLSENTGICFVGPSAKGPFDLDAPIARSMLDAPLNVNGRPNSDVIRPVASAVDLVQCQRGRWTIDFGSMSLEEASVYEMPFEYAKKNVFPIRTKNKRGSNTDRWWQYERPRLDMRQALSGMERYIATPRVAKHRVFIWLDSATLANDGTTVIARKDDYFLGVLHSKPHELWALRLGTSLGNTPRYTPTTTFETFPFPWPPGQEPTDDPRVLAIAQAAKELVEKRDNWLNPPSLGDAELKKRTLTNLYNARPTWLDLAHKKLDKAVLGAYGWSDLMTADGINADEVLARLLALNLERSKGQPQVQPTLMADEVQCLLMLARCPTKWR